MANVGFHAAPPRAIGKHTGLATRAMRPVAAWPFRQVILPSVFIMATVLLWHIAIQRGGISPNLLPRPEAVAAMLWTNFALLIRQAVPTVAKTGIAFVLAVGCGVALGSLVMLSRRLRQAILPYVLLFQFIPKVAFGPLFVVWFGSGPQSSFAFAVFFAFFPILVSTVTGLNASDRNALRLCRSLRASAWQTFRYVRFPYALPHIFAGMKVGVTMTLIGVIVGEFISAQAGLGYIILFSASSYETALLFAAIALLCCIGIGLFGLVHTLQYVVLRGMDAKLSTNEF
jgi:NitT/TauT family transport system permease protein